MQESAVLSLAATPEVDVARLYEEHAPFIGRVIWRLTGGGAHVDDLLQETFLVAFKKRAELRSQHQARAWLYAIASHLCQRYNRGARRFSLFRSRYAREPGPRPVTRPDQALEQEQTVAMVYEALSRLPFKHREAFVLYELEELEGQEIAEMVGVPVGTVWTRLHHARKKFEARMRRRLSTETERAGS
jgi:RNA polymerase sigma-70 factor (ECF subfamily)